MRPVRWRLRTTTSAAKVERLKAHGAAHVIDVATEDYGARIKEITGGRGADIVFDAVGGPGMNVDRRRAPRRRERPSFSMDCSTPVRWIASRR